MNLIVGVASRLTTRKRSDDNITTTAATVRASTPGLQWHSRLQGEF